MNILFLSHTAMGGDFVVGSHHLARQMVRQGHSVAHVSAPISPAHAILLKSRFIRKKMRRCVVGGEFVDGVLDVVPPALLPWKLAKSIPLLKGLLYHPISYIEAAFRRHGFGAPDLIVMDEPRLVGLCDLFPRSRLVYRPTDLYSHMRDDASITDIERTIVASGRFILIAMSRPIGKHLQDLGAIHVSIMENGVDYEFFSTPQNLPEFLELPSGPKAVYVGAMDERFSIKHVIEAAKLSPTIKFIMLGPAPDKLRIECRRHPNIIFMGPMGYDFLPSILQRCDVALLPLSEHPANDGRSPMKVYEYGAAGLPVAATETTELQARKLPFVRLCKDPEEFSNAVKYISDKGIETTSKRAAQIIASEQCWKQKSTTLICLCSAAASPLKKI